MRFWFLPAFVILLFSLALIPGTWALSLEVTANNGSVVVTPEKEDYDQGEVVELLTRPDTGYSFRGWAGDAQGKRLVLNLTMDSDKSVIANFGVWEPPIGIPPPEFGIFETHYMYVGQTYDYGGTVAAYGDGGNGPYTHYIDNTDGLNCTDDDNPYGTEANPRCNFPSLSTIGPGAVVEINGGPYGQPPDFLINGDQAHPIFIRGASADEMPIFAVSELRVRGHYIIIENIHFTTTERTTVQVYPQTAYEEVHHVSVRHCESGGMMYARGIADYVQAEDVVFYNNHIHFDYMIPPDNPEQDDWTGIILQYDSNRTWVVDNHIHHMPGDCIGGAHAAAYSVSNYYIGRNILHDTSENALDIKQADTVIISENIMYNYAGGGAASRGSAVGFGYGNNSKLPAKNVWFLYNEVYNAKDSGIGASALQSSLHIIGNIVHDIRNAIVAPYWFEHFDKKELIFDKLVEHGHIDAEGNVDPLFDGLSQEFKNEFPEGYNQFTYIDQILIDALNSDEVAEAYNGSGTKDVYLINNVFYDNDIGIRSDAGGGVPYVVSVYNNIISKVSENGYHLRILDSMYYNAAEVNNNIFYQPGGEARIGSYSFYNVSEFQAATDKCGGCFEENPLFVGPENNDFSLPEGSPAIGAGTEHSVYQLFEEMFGIDISVDIEGNPRTGAWDIGAFEAEETASCVTLELLLEYIDQWKQGSMTMPYLIDRIARWKSGEGC